MRYDHLRCVVWPRKPIKSKGSPTGKVYRYTVVGMLVSDTPIDSIEGKNEVILDGGGYGLRLGDTIGSIVQKKPKFKLGDATEALLALGDVVEEEDFIKSKAFIGQDPKHFKKKVGKRKK